MEGLVRAAALTDFAEVSRSLGYDAAAALRRAGLSPRVLDEPEMRLPAGVVMQLLETAARATNCDTFGLRMAQSRQVSNFGAISLLLTHLGTLRDVLRAKGYNVVHEEFAGGHDDLAWQETFPRGLIALIGSKTVVSP